VRKGLCTLLIGLLGVIAATAAVDPPSLRCISVLPNGDIQIDWMAPNDPGGEFVNYNIYGSLNGGAYTLIDNSITNRLQSTYVHVGAGITAASSYKYYVTTTYTQGASNQTSATSDTIEPIIPNVAVSGRLSGTVTWNPIMTSLPITARPNYDIKRGFTNAGGALNQLGQVPVADPRLYKDSVERCKDEVLYQIELPDLTGCVSRSLVGKAKLEDVTPPPVVGLDSVSVINNGQFTLLGWPSSNADDHAGYVIIWTDPLSGATFIDTLYRDPLTGADRNWFADTALARSPFLNSQSFSIAVIDKCGLTSGNGNLVHNTMYLSVTPNYCERSAGLSWNSYRAWITDGSLVSYTVLESVNGGPYKQVAKVSAAEDSISIPGLKPLDTYTYIIQAQNNKGFTSSSNAASVVFDNVIVPKRTEILVASVTEENYVEIECFVDPNKDIPIERFVLTRGFTEDGPFKPIASMPNNNKDSLLSFVDSLSSPEQGPVYYVLNAIDQCDAVFASSGVAKTIHLSGEVDDYKYSHDLHWDGYQGWEHFNANVLRYQLFRKLTTEDGYSWVNNLSATWRYYTDDIQNDLKYGGEFCYRIRAVQDSSGLYPYIDTAWSNVHCFQSDLDVWIPNSFTPNSDGVNDVFKPVVNFVSPENGDYEFVVYSRFGDEIWRTNDPAIGWDAEGLDGTTHPGGVYVFYIKARSVFGGEFEKRGSVVLFR